MTKEEVLRNVMDERKDSFSLWEDEGHDFFDGKCSTVFKAMEEYAKQEAIAFERFLVKGYTYVPEQGFWYNIEKQHEGAEPFDREELYTLYLQSKI